jgi:hypothetical protein
VHSTRLATFLLGAWIACCLLLDLLSLQNLRLAGQLLNSAIPPASEILQNAGREQMRLLLHHFAAEQYRYYFSLWGLIQIPGALLLAAVLYFAAEKRIIPQVLCGLMLALVLFQLAINPELTFRGREADFPPGSQSLGTQARGWVLTEIWIGVEMVKLLMGGALTNYIFTYKSRRRARRTEDPISPVKVASRSPS